MESAFQRAMKQLEAGADILDIGGASSRPGADFVDEDAELMRVLPLLRALLQEVPGAIISVDTWRSAVALAALEAGASIINDISAGSLDPRLPGVVAAHPGTPYVLMHMQGTPKTMQENPAYQHPVLEILDFLVQKIHQLRQKGIRDIIVDPGFGFGKTLHQNFELLKRLPVFPATTGCPLLVGVSRKSMIYKTLNVGPDEALNGSTALHMAALSGGAHILRVHDCREAVETIKLFELLHAQREG